jgi:hypothetical protein
MQLSILRRTLLGLGMLAASLLALPAIPAHADHRDDWRPPHASVDGTPPSVTVHFSMPGSGDSGTWPRSIDAWHVYYDASNGRRSQQVEIGDNGSGIGQRTYDNLNFAPLTTITFHVQYCVKHTFSSDDCGNWADVPVTVPGALSVPANPPPSDACSGGQVWRLTRPQDHVCVTTLSAFETQMENVAQASDPNLHRDPNRAAGTIGCAPGYVWRDAYDGDGVCVPPERRDQVHAEGR